LIRKYYLHFFLLILFSQVAVGYVEKGKLAPGFDLVDSQGNVVSLEAYKGQMVVLEWTNHGCPFVVRHYETGNMQSTQKFAKNNNVVWFSIISSAPGTQGFVTSKQANELSLKREAFPSHVLIDKDGKVGKLYGAKTTPHMYVIDSNGVLQYQGAIDDAGGRGFMKKDLLNAKNYVKRALDELMSGKNVSISETRPYGCSVKYST